MQELWDANTQAFEEPEVDLPKTVAEAALQDGAFEDIGQVQDDLANLQFQEPGNAAVDPKEPAFRDAGTVASSDDEAEAEEAPAWTCSYALANTLSFLRGC